MYPTTQGQSWPTRIYRFYLNLEFELLSDIDREVVEAYDAKFVGLGGIDGYVSANRVVIVIDKDGIVKHRWVAENPGVEPDYDDLMKIADSLN